MSGLKKINERKFYFLSVRQNKPKTGDNYGKKKFTSAISISTTGTEQINDKRKSTESQRENAQENCAGW